MTKFLAIPLLLLLQACPLTPAAQEEIRQLETVIAQAQQQAAEATTDAERLEAMIVAQEARNRAAEVKAEDYGKQTGLLWELAFASLGLGGLGAARTFGRSRASRELAQMRERLEAFERGMNQVPEYEDMYKHVDEFADDEDDEDYRA